LDLQIVGLCRDSVDSIHEVPLLEERVSTRPAAKVLGYVDPKRRRRLDNFDLGAEERARVISAEALPVRLAVVLGRHVQGQELEPSRSPPPIRQVSNFQPSPKCRKAPRKHLPRRNTSPSSRRETGLLWSRRRSPVREHPSGSRTKAT